MAEPEPAADTDRRPWMPATAETPPHVWVSFELTGVPFDHDYVTAQLGIQPTAPDAPIEPDHSENGRHVGGTWGVAVGPLNALEITAMLSELIALIAPAQNELRRVRDELHLDATITCVVEPTSTQTPEIRFPRDTIRWAAQNDVAIAVELALPRT
ncbi:MAG: hypothetical protein QOI89_953 [Solirubrobacteraceae bacterium]|nr:hypothetical protein [Solirubrobacteraceae bacterium]